MHNRPDFWRSRLPPPAFWRMRLRVAEVARLRGRRFGRRLENKRKLRWQSSNRRYEGRNDYLRRLPDGYYRDNAYVHWSMTIDDRKHGWLTQASHAQFRELLTHTMFRYGLCCPIYCCMPDHLHLLWIGVAEDSDQRAAARYFRKHWNAVLEHMGFRLQQQGYDHVLRDEERDRNAFEEVAEYIARNPERAGIVPAGGFRAYPFTGNLVPGYPDLALWQSDYWDRMWRASSWLRKHGLCCPRKGAP
jgi:putative transposase